MPAHRSRCRSSRRTTGSPARGWPDPAFLALVGHVFPLGRRAPVAGVDAVDSAEQALGLLEIAVARPLRPEIVVVALDELRHGSTVLIVTDTDRPGQVLGVVETVSAVLPAPSTAMFLASVRPRGGLVAADVDRWFEASALAAAHGVELLDWFVVSPGIAVSPREVAGEPERW